MQEKQKQTFSILCETVLIILKSYQHQGHLPDWVLHFFHPRLKEVSSIKNKITAIKNLDESHKKLKVLEDDLIKSLDKDRYFISVHTKSKRLRNKIQDAMVAVLFLSKEDEQAYKKYVIDDKNVDAYLNYLEQDEALEVYKAHYKTQRAIYGRFIGRLSDEEIVLAAKGGMINGKLTDRFDVKWMIAHGLHYIRTELLELKKEKIEEGFLRSEAIVGYLEKLDFLLHPANELQNDEGALVQNARYLLEDIMNAAGVQKNAIPRHKSHHALIKGCYWVDEMFKVVKGQFDVEAITE